MSKPVPLLAIREKANLTVWKLDKKITIGRSPEREIILSAKGISRCHATIYYENSIFFLVDGDLQGNVSTNGVWVNGEKILRHKLSSLDIISFEKDTHAFFWIPQHFPSTEESLKLFFEKSLIFANKKELNVNSSENFNTQESLCQTTISENSKNYLLDDLTGLPNRSTFFKRVERSILFSQNIDEEIISAVLFIDVDRFKLINDSLGHLMGDKLLIGISRRLNDCLRGGDLVARLGGDEFGILLSNLQSIDEAVLVAKRIQQQISKPFMIEDQEIYPSVSIGVALSTLGYKAVEDIIRDADTAMYRAKKTGKSKFVVFDKEMHEEASKLFQLDAALRTAIENNQLQLYYQPIVSIKHKRLSGFEALIRWKHPQKGFISPDIFIPISEENNLIYRIGDWVINEACRQLSVWKTLERHPHGLTMNINISSKQLYENSFAEKIIKTTQKYGLTPSDLKLEVTESLLMENVDYATKVFMQLKDHGFHLAIDDFGTGYSSLNYLNKFPVNTLKIDRSFVAKVNDIREQTSINVTHSIIRLARSLSFEVVAEGIENTYQLVWLQEQKCDYGQGYLFSKPLTAEEASCLINEGFHWKWKC